jgi:hypothetical protein
MHVELPKQYFTRYGSHMKNTGKKEITNILVDKDTGSYGNRK